MIIVESSDFIVFIFTAVSPAGVRPWSKLSGADSGSQRGARPLRSKPAPATPLTAKSAVVCDTSHPRKYLVHSNPVVVDSF